MRNRSYASFLFIVSSIFWMVFWLYKGMDRFLSPYIVKTKYSDITLFTNDTRETLMVKFHDLGLMTTGADAANYFLGVWELLIAVPLMLALIMGLYKAVTEVREEAFSIGMGLSMFTMLAYAVLEIATMDVTALTNIILTMAALTLTIMALNANEALRRVFDAHKTERREKRALKEREEEEAHMQLSRALNLIKS